MELKIVVKIDEQAAQSLKKYKYFINKNLNFY